MWAIGVMYYAMLYGKLPFYSQNDEEMINQITNAPLKFDEDIFVTDDCKDILRNMLEKNSEKRIKLLDLL